MGLLLGCAPAAIGELDQEQPVDVLRSTIEELAGTVAVQEGLADSATEERLALKVQIGELARRIAEDEFTRFDGEKKGLLDYEAALQLCLRVIEQAPDQSYLLEDIVFLPDFASFRPDIHVGPVWQFRVQGTAGRFIVTIDAQSGALVYVNRVSESE
jgi:hypothetical protein